jgi:hypothetical protein
MFVIDSVAFPTRYQAAGRRLRFLAGRGVAVSARALVRSWRRHQSLQAWNQSLPRPAGCAHLPPRVWRRNSAFLAMQSLQLRDLSG